MNSELAHMFFRMADAMQILGDNAFKAIVFQKVARRLEELDFDVADRARSGELPAIEGVGASSRRIIEQYARDGVSQDYEQLMSAVPVGVMEMLRIPGTGPKTAAIIWKQCKIESVQELETAIRDGTLPSAKGIGAKKLADMLDGIRIVKAGIERRGIIDVLPIVEKFSDRLRNDPRVGELQVAGSIRRRRETIGDVDLLCWLKTPFDAPLVMSAFCTQPGVEKVLGGGSTKGSVLVSGGLQLDLRIVPRASFGAALQYFTGSKEHNVRLRGLANSKGLTLNEWGLYRLDEYDKAAKPVGEAPAVPSLAGETEESVYQALSLPWVPPELREDRGELDAAADNTLPVLVQMQEIKGDLHCHTTASDGVGTIEQMAQAAKDMGYQYIAITDHSVSSVIANGLNQQRLRDHIKAIRKIKVSGIHILAGSEVDILPDGRLDYDQSLLAELDIAIASPHATLKQDATKATDRILRAIETRYVNIIGHPTGRVINQRDGLPLDMAKVIAAAAKTGTALEINAVGPGGI